MISADTSAPLLDREARALLDRVTQIKSFSATMPAVPGATPSPSALRAIESHLMGERRELKRDVQRFLDWLHSAAGCRSSLEHRQRRFALLRMRFNAELDSLDIFADVLNQRSEHETGLWLGGLDAVASDGLLRPGLLSNVPPIVTYLDRGHGAAIRRARTRLPGRGANPVAVIRVPRERMVGSSIGASLLHEVGHQAAALLNLVGTLHEALLRQASPAGVHRMAWSLWERWISEVVADLWALGTLGVAATTGLIGVVSLPRAFVFRLQLDDPHPFPWVRVKLSCEMGRQLFEDPQWSRLERVWDSFYPLAGLSAPKQRLIGRLLETLPDFVELLLEHRSPRLRWRSLREALPAQTRTPIRLRQLFAAWDKDPAELCGASPTLVMAVLGQAAADERISSVRENWILAQMLRHWALTRPLSPIAGQIECGRGIDTAPRDERRTIHPSPSVAGVRP